MDTTHKTWKVRYQYKKDKFVHVYRNLSAEGEGLWSIKQDKLVRIHASHVMLKDVTFHVQPAGNAKVRREGKKHVHAYVKGWLSSSEELNGIRAELNLGEDDFLEYFPVTYDPYRFTSFVNRDTHDPIYACDFLDMDITDSLAKLIAIFKRPMKEDWL
jgi:hypothetical protein